MTQDEKINYAFDLRTEFGFFGHQYESGYRVIGNTLLRIKDHKANYAYFQEAVEDNPLVKKIVSVSFCDSDCRNVAATSIEEFKAEYPGFDVVEVTFDCEETSLEDAIKLIKKHVQ